MIKEIILDFDGVIQDTFQFHRKHLNKFVGINLSEQAFSKLHEYNFFLNKTGPFAKVDWNKYQKYIHNEFVSLKIDSETKKYLSFLAERYNLYVITSTGLENVLGYLKNNNLQSFFKEVLGLEQGLSKVDKFKFLFKKYKFSNKSCIFITDSLSDIFEVKKVKCKVIAETFGFNSRKQLEKGRPDWIVDNWREIIKKIETLDV